MVRDLAEFGSGSNEGCHLVAERFPKMTSQSSPGAVLRSLPRASKTNIAARNKRFDSREAEELKLAPQSLHLHCPPAHVDRAEKSKEPRHAGLPPNDDARPGADRRVENRFGAAPDHAANR